MNASTPYRITSANLPRIGASFVPTLFWWGADDTFGGEDVARSMVAAMPDAELCMVPDAGHLPRRDAPEAAAATTTSFLTAEVTSR